MTKNLYSYWKEEEEDSDKEICSEEEWNETMKMLDIKEYDSLYDSVYWDTKITSSTPLTSTISTSCF